MKKFVLLLAFISLSFSSFSQNNRIDFFDLTRAFDWNQSEVDFEKKYNDRIIFNTDSISDIHAATGNWLLDNVCIGKYETTTFVRYDAENQITVVFAFPTEINQEVCIDVKNIVNDELGNPDVYLNDASLASFNLAALGFEKGDLKIWALDSLSFILISAGDDEGEFIGIGATTPMDKDPDFREGFWGDSLADVKKKEGKADEFNIDGIYAFTTYVAGFECLAAYRFTDDKLTSGKYVFLNNTADNCIRNYEKLSHLLMKKYGEPAANNKQNLAESYERRIYTDGELVRRGKMKFETYWVTPFSMVAISLDGEQYQVALSIEYYSNKLRKEREEDILKDL